MQSFMRNNSRRNPEQVKREGWRELRLLAVSAEDPRLDAFERQFVINLGSRLYGEPLPESNVENKVIPVNQSPSETAP